MGLDEQKAAGNERERKSPNTEGFWGCSILMQRREGGNIRLLHSGLGLQWGEAP